jgi:hypothetical protein
MLLLSEFTVSSMRPGCVHSLHAVAFVVVFLQPIFFSSSSSFLFFCKGLNLTEASAITQRFLSGYALNVSSPRRPSNSKTCANVGNFN